MEKLRRVQSGEQRKAGGESFKRLLSQVPARLELIIPQEELT